MPVAIYTKIMETAVIQQKLYVSFSELNILSYVCCKKKEIMEVFIC
jgi:hypothetical protein